jgi:uncharacterized protein (TIGR00251 family)
MTAPLRLRLRVSPGAPRPEVVGRHGGAWKVRVAAAPSGGRANEAVVGLLSEALGVRRSDVEIVSGQGARDKIVSLGGIDAAELERRLASAAVGSGRRRL